MQVVYVLEWTESEAGWGCRPDGISVHFSREAVQQYVDDHWARMKEMYGNKTPHEYSRADAKDAYPAKLCREHCDERILMQVMKEESFRDWRNNPKYIEKL